MHLLKLTNNSDTVPEGLTSCWLNFHDHICNLLVVQYPHLFEHQKSKVWERLRDQELTKWNAELLWSTDTDFPPGKRQCYLKFPDAESLLAFELAWR